jgi:acetyl-CoA synthetase
VPEHFNFAFDVLDQMAREAPDERALEWCNPAGEARTFSFADISRNRAAAPICSPRWA